MRLLVLAPLILVSACLPHQQSNQIIVDGEAIIERAPDQFKLTASIRAREENEAAALTEISGSLSAIREQLPNLVGLTHLDIEARDASIRSIIDPECREKARYNAEDECPVIGNFGTIQLTVTGSPAILSGNALSALSELGAESVSLSGYSIMDRDAARAEAMEAAVRDARRKAETIAQASGSTVIGPLRVQYGEGFSDPGSGYQYDGVSDTIVVTATRAYAPETEINLDPGPIKIREKVVAAFEIE